MLSRRHVDPGEYGVRKVPALRFYLPHLLPIYIYIIVFFISAAGAHKGEIVEPVLRHPDFKGTAVAVRLEAFHVAAPRKPCKHG